MDIIQYIRATWDKNSLRSVIVCGATKHMTLLLWYISRLKEIAAVYSGDSNILSGFLTTRVTRASEAGRIGDRPPTFLTVDNPHFSLFFGGCILHEKCLNSEFKSKIVFAHIWT